MLFRSRNPRECAVAKRLPYQQCLKCLCRNPRECAVAKGKIVKCFLHCFLSQPARMRCGKDHIWRDINLRFSVATRANALWQRWRTRRDVRQRTGRNPHECAVAKVKPLQLNQKPFGRNPHECAVAKLHGFSRFRKTSRRNPHECAVAKVQDAKNTSHVVRRNPRECAEAKTRHCCARTRNPENMNYVLLF